MKNILFASSECVPFIKTGGLADVVGSLPKYYNSKKYDVRVVLPKYDCMDQKWKEKMEYVEHFYIHIAGQDQYVGILKCVLDKIIFYFITFATFTFFDRPPFHPVFVQKVCFFLGICISSMVFVN